MACCAPLDVEGGVAHRSPRRFGACCAPGSRLTPAPPPPRQTLQRLLKEYGNERFKCGEDDDGYPLRIKLKYYMEYMKVRPRRWSKARGGG